ncbi:MAG: flagellar motor switch protein FliN [Selenomonadaceae bacterium]|nr:flagellar motor switch protein FliN [Selenomonadaceae bacterium]
MANLKATNTAGGRRKGMFALRLKDNLEVRTLEELRDNFDLEKAVEYFHSGELLQWLEDRFYDDEADAIRELDGDDPNLAAKLCAVLNVECDVNLEFVRRLREKKAYLVEHTDDQTIIDNAAATALDQGDLGELIQLGYTTIYLCGEQFNVPIRVAGVKYVGILGAPKIKIRAKSQDDLDAQNISFENVQLPWQKVISVEPVQITEENIEQILDVPLKVTVELGQTKKTIKEIFDLATGSIIELDRLAGEPVEIQVNGHLLGKGEVVVIDENFGVRVTEIATPAERAMNLR